MPVKITPPDSDNVSPTLRNAVIGNADNVAGPGLVHRLAFRSKEQNGIVDADGFAGARLFQLHIAAKAAGRQPQESHPVAMIGVHIGLTLKTKPVTSSSEGCTARPIAVWSRGGGA